MELAKAKAEREERERLERLELELAERRLQQEIEAHENILRVDQLVESDKLIKLYYQDLKLGEDSKELFEREIFIECRAFPDLAKLNDVNSFYADWVNQIRSGPVTLENIFQRTSTILQIIDEMQEFLKLPPDTSSTESLREMGLIYHKFCKTQQEFLDEGSYNIVIDLRNLFDPELGVFENSLSTAEIVHSLWGNLYSSPKYRGHFFDSLNFRFRLPDSIVLVKGIYRLLKTEYDHFSNTSNSFYPPNVENFHRLSIQNSQRMGTLSKSQQLIRDESKFIAIAKVQKTTPKIGKIKEEKAESETIKEKWGAVQSGQKPEAPRTVADLLSKETMEMLGPGIEQLMKKSKDHSDETEGEQRRTSENEMQNPTESDVVVQQPDDETKNSGMEPVGPEENVAKEGDQSRKRAGEQSSKSALQKSTPSSVDSSKKGKKIKAKAVPNAEDRPKTEAELAKERERKEKANFLPYLIHPNELNLRNYVILAGVYNFKLYEIPPQPKPRGRNVWTLHQIESEEVLKEIEFVADYIPPPPSDLSTIRKTPEEMEREAKRQEEELQKLVQLEIKVPKVALWFDPPTPVRWEHDMKTWSTEGFYDVRFREDSLQLSLRTTRFGIIGLAHNRWSNLPYQSWELRPNGTNCVTFNLMAAMVVIEFTVKDDLVCVSSLQNVMNSDQVEQAVLQKYMRPGQLIKALRSHGLDVFPEFDSYAYVDGILVKQIEAEDHMYQCMAIGATAFNFQWSRWNLLAGRQKMIYQIRERIGTTTPMILNTPKSAMLINCTEVSPTYSEEKTENYEYSADLLQLMNRISTDDAIQVINSTSGQFVGTLQELLSSVRPLSFS